MQLPRVHLTGGLENKNVESPLFEPVFTFLAEMVQKCFSLYFESRGCVHPFFNVKGDLKRTHQCPPKRVGKHICYALNRTLPNPTFICMNAIFQIANCVVYDDA